MPSAFRNRFAIGLLLVLSVGLVAGCGGAGVDAPESDPTTDGPGDVKHTPTDRSVITPPPGVAMPDGPIYNVTIYTSGAILYVDNLELEFNRRRGIQGFFGFREDDLTKMVQIPWSDVFRVDIGNVIGQTLWDQVRNTREQQNLRREEIFETQITYPDRTVMKFYAVIPKLRGWRNQQIWELGMANNPAGFRYIEFDR